MQQPRQSLRRVIFPDIDGVPNAGRVHWLDDLALHAGFTEDGKRGVFVLLNSDPGVEASEIGQMLLRSLP